MNLEQSDANVKSLQVGPRRRSRLGCLAAILGLSFAALSWILLLGAVWWWLPRPSRASLATSDKLLLVGFSSDGSTLVTIKPREGVTDFEKLFRPYSGPIQIWNTQTGEEQARVAEGWGRIQHVALSPKGDVIAVQDEGGPLKLWDVRTGQERGSLRTRRVKYPSPKCGFSPDGGTLAWHSEDRGFIHLWDTATGKHRASLKTASHVFVFSPDGKALATIEPSELWGEPNRSDPRALRIWDVSNGKLKTTLAPKLGPFESVGFTPDGETLATGTDWVGGLPPSELIFWDPATKRERAVVRQGLPLNGLEFSPDGSLLVITHHIFGIAFITYEVLDVTRLPPVAVPHCQHCAKPVFSPDGKLLAIVPIEGLGLFTALSDKKAQPKEALGVKLINVATKQVDLTLDAGPWKSISPPVFSPDGRFIAADGSYLPVRGVVLNEVKVWEALTGRNEATLRGYRQPMFSPDGKTLAAVSHNAVTLWDVPVPTRAWRLVGAVACWALVPLLTYKLYKAWKKKACQ